MAKLVKEPVRVVIAGAAGQIGYALIPLFCSGEVFGPDQPLYLHLLEIEAAMGALKGVSMEIEDGAYPLVHGVVLTYKPEEAFKDVDYAVLVGGFPRKQGMERKDLLDRNVPIFKTAGQALEKFGKVTTKILVVANPANTNCLTCASYAPKIPRENFCALTRLDMNRAKSQIAIKLKKNVGEIKNVIIWGNHSSTQVPDLNDAKIVIGNTAEPVVKSIDPNWVKNEFRPIIQQRGKAVIEARGLSSAMSAANAIKDCLHDWVFGTSKDEHVSMAVSSDGSYGIKKGLIYSYPCTCENGKWKIVQLKVEKDIDELMKKSEKELIEEAQEAGLNI